MLTMYAIKLITLSYHVITNTVSISGVLHIKSNLRLYGSEQHLK